MSIRCVSQLTLQKKAEYIRPNRNTHCVNGSLTTAHGRVALDRGIRVLLEDANTRLLYCDTDSIIYATSRCSLAQLPCHGEILGKFKGRWGPSRQRPPATLTPLALPFR